MRWPVLWFAIVASLLGILTTPHADARGAASGGRGGGMGRVARGGNFAIHIGHAFHPARFANQRFRPFAARRLNQRRFAQNDFSGIWPGYGYWPDDWSDGGGYAYQPQPAPAQPQVIVIHADADQHLVSADPMPDYSYVAGCHAIPNGYHCDTAATAH
jgi:hypothetical protein